MGMYDHFDGLKCPNCNVLLEWPQTKDGPKTLRHLKPGSVFKQPRDCNGYYNLSDKMIAYGQCPQCEIMWDVEIPLIKVTGMVVVSPDTDLYRYSNAEWAKQLPGV